MIFLLAMSAFLQSFSKKLQLFIIKLSYHTFEAEVLLLI